MQLRPRCRVLRFLEMFFPLWAPLFYCSFSLKTPSREHTSSTSIHASLSNSALNVKLLLNLLRVHTSLIPISAPRTTSRSLFKIIIPRSKQEPSILWPTSLTGCKLFSRRQSELQDIPSYRYSTLPQPHLYFDIMLRRHNRLPVGHSALVHHSLDIIAVNPSCPARGPHTHRISSPILDLGP
jgi:hypothetical protein